MKFKRIFCLFLCFALFFNISAFADTDVNVDGSSGGNPTRRIYRNIVKNIDNAI